MQASQTMELPSTGRIRFWNQIRWRLIGAFVLLAVLPMVLVVSIIVSNTINQIRQQTLNGLEAIAQLKQDQLDRWVRDSQSTLEQFPIGRHAEMVRDGVVSFEAGELAEGEQRALETLFAQAASGSSFFEELFLYTPEGVILASSSPVQTGKLVVNQPYYTADLAESSFQTPYYDLSVGGLTMVLTHILQDEQTGEPIGVLAGRLDLTTLGDIMLERTGLGETGETYLVSAESNYLLTPSRFEEDGYPQERAYHSIGIDEALAGNSGDGLYPGYRRPGVPVLGVYRWLPDLQVALLAEIAVEEAFAPAERMRNLGVAITAVAAIGAAILGYVVTQRISSPILSLAEVALQMAAGDLSQHVTVKDKTEVGLLARAFNSMTEQLSSLIGGLEQRVAERTYALVVSAEVGSNISQKINDLDDLLAYAVEHIAQRFDVYYTQIYLVDVTGKFLDLRVGTGSVGRKLVKRGHRLTIGSGSINGTAAAEKRTILVKDTQTNPMHKPNPLLPQTRLELCVPLMAGDKLIGVLNMQSNTPYSFSEEDVPALEVLAVQLAIAVENARLFQESLDIKERLELQIQQNVTQSWGRYLDGIHQNELVGYRYEAGKVVEMQKAGARPSTAGVQMPVTVMGKSVGSITVEDVNPNLWSEEDVAIIRAIAEQVGQRIENLRLLDEAKRYHQEAEEASRRLLREGWQMVQEERAVTGYVYDHYAVSPLTDATAVTAPALQAPLLVQGEPVGFLELADLDTTNTYTAEFLTAVATRLSAHLENLRLTRQTEQALSEARQRTAELNILNEMGAAFAAARETEEMLTLIQTFTSRLIPITENFYIALYDETLNEITIHLFYIPGEITHSNKVENIIRRRSSNGVTEYVMRTRKPLLVNGDMAVVAAEMGFEAIGARAKSWMGVPLVIGDRVLGVLAMQSFDAANQYGEHQLELLMAVASGAAIALEGIRLLQQVQSRARQEQILREVTARVYTAVDAESILRATAQEINRRLGLETFIYLEDQIQTDSVAADGGNGHN
ncbi:MAG: GAF domain-containing protein [Ardenticatenaceae bacterium]|nr:GAF domain-containing protein [Ardenticatenaceae bacterium]